MIVGTAGHVDHGKTTLARALTGAPLDRLPEERRRGLTLELGFAPLPLPGGLEASLIDVPGHERLLRTMAAGAGGVDLALLVIAADEGVRPQTREHLEVCRLLGVPAGLVVFTRVDLASEGWREMRRAEVRALVEGSCFARHSPLEVNAPTGAGLAALRHAIAEGLGALPAARGIERPFLLPIDRGFSRPGAGTVVTGTVWSGRIAPGELVVLEPGDTPRRVRALQAHGRAVGEGRPGMRLALNVPDLPADAAGTLVRPGQVTPARRLDVLLELVPSARPLPRRSERTLWLGTASHRAEVRLLSERPLEGGGMAPAQVLLREPAWVLPGMRFVVQGERLQGGGEVLAVDVPRRRTSAAARVIALKGRTVDERILEVLDSAGARGVPAELLAARVPFSARDLSAGLEGLIPSKVRLVGARRAQHALLSAREPSSTEDVSVGREGGGSSQGGGGVRAEQEPLSSAPASFDDVRSRRGAAAAQSSSSSDDGRVGLDGPSSLRRSGGQPAPASFDDFSTGRGASAAQTSLSSDDERVGLDGPSSFRRSGEQQAPASSDDVNARLAGLITPQVLGVGTRLVLASLLDALALRVRALVGDDALSMETARQRLGLDAEVMNTVVAQLVASQQLVLVAGTLRGLERSRPPLPGPALVMLKELEARGLAPPTRAEWSARLQHPEPAVAKMGEALVAQGFAVRAGDLFFHRPAVDALEARLRAWLAEHERIDFPAFKALTRVSRKFALPLLERFDAVKVTLRVGPHRVLRSRP